MEIEEIKDKYEDYKKVENLVCNFKKESICNGRVIKARCNHVDFCGTELDGNEMVARIRLSPYFLLQDKERPNTPSYDEKEYLLDNMNYRVAFYAHFIKAINKSIDSLLLLTLEGMREELEACKGDIDKEVTKLNGIYAEFC